MTGFDYIVLFIVGVAAVGGFMRGLVQEVLIDTPPPPMPVSVLYPHNRHMSPRVRVFVDWLGEVFAGAV